MLPMHNAQCSYNRGRGLLIGDVNRCTALVPLPRLGNVMASGLCIVHRAFASVALTLIPTPFHEPPAAVAIAVNAAERAIVQRHIPFVPVPRLWACARVSEMNDGTARTGIPRVRVTTRGVSHRRGGGGGRPAARAPPPRRRGPR